MPQSQQLITIKNLKVSFDTKQGEVKAVDGISYTIKKGETLGVVGESGCGKSVSSYAILGILQHPGRIVSGEILFQGKDITKISQAEQENLRGGKISMIFQEALTALNPVLKIGYQIGEQIRKHTSLNQKESYQKAEHLLNLVGIPSPRQRLKEYPHQLSGGMKQRVMIAMALSCDPDLLIADEPTTALDVTIQAQILELIQSLQEKFNMTVQFITHDLGVISELADDIIVMYAGRIIESGPNEEIFLNPIHPYTKGLLSSIPKIKKRTERLFTIPGTVPTPLNLPLGCAFNNRCELATERCYIEVPELETIKETNQQVSCFNIKN